ncbi:MAG TPA: alpha/beta hydrolase [Candidatus Acidoferrales bacterium]
MKKRIAYAVLASMALLGAMWMRVSAQNSVKNVAKVGVANAAVAKAMPPDSIPTYSTENIARTGFFYVGGKYVGEPGKEVMDGAMYVEVWVPKQIQHPYPIVFFHGAGQTGTDWLQTPDNRPGWAYYLIAQGYTLYMVDYPARGRSAYVPGVDGSLTIRTANDLESIWTNVKEKGNFPLKNNHTQWPGAGKMGDPIFDNFAKGQVEFLGGGPNNAEKLNMDAGVALLDRIGNPVILVTHSMGGGVGWAVADARPNLVKGIVTVEPGGGINNLKLHYDPPVADPKEIKTYKEEKGEREGENPCTLQEAPVHKLVSLEHIAILSVSGNGGYHRQGDACTPKWLNQAGVKTDFVRLEDVGINGNGHEMFFEKNSDQIIKFLDDWMRKNVK